MSSLIDHLRTQVESAQRLLHVLLAQRAPAEDPPLMPGDSLQVPRSPF